ncbi:MAG: sugar ABC transporter permease [Anaerolineae bacterium]|nr:sugar ABC transporter permease [Anaerolineae bacterium]MCB0256435.1 sugar ABC transporter permease [Anaerolineae bacterium]
MNSVQTSAAEKTQRSRKRRSGQQTDLVPGILLAAPAILLLLMFLIGPFFAGIGFSFTNIRLISANPTEWVGLRNYQRLTKIAVLSVEPVVDPATGQPMVDENGDYVFPRSRDFTRDEESYPQYAGTREWFTVDTGTTRHFVLAGDPAFMKSLVNVIFFALVVIPLQTSLGLLLAILVNQKLKARNFFRTIYFSPVVTSMVVISIVWVFLYDKDNGLINQFLGLFGIAAVNWLGNSSTAIWAIIIMSVWQGVGFQMVLFLAGLQGIPDYLYEAASIDGANILQKFRYVTIPGLRSIFVFIIITITIAAFQLFTQVFVMTNGGPNDATTTVVFHMVRKGFREQDIAVAAAIGVLFFLFILAISMVQRFVLRDKEA